MYSACNSVGRESLLLRHFIAHFPPNFSRILLSGFLAFRIYILTDLIFIFLYLSRTELIDPFGRIKYFIFSFPRSTNEAKRGVKFCHSTRNVSRIRCKVGNGSVLMGTGYLNIRLPGSLYLPCYVRDTFEKMKYFSSGNRTHNLSRLQSPACAVK